jgi:ATP-dependent DNA helicase RecQ
VIFHDATLREMLRVRPESREALLGITGIGQAKLERFGDDFLAVLRGAG